MLYSHLQKKSLSKIRSLNFLNARIAVEEFQATDIYLSISKFWYSVQLLKSYVHFGRLHLPTMMYENNLVLNFNLSTVNADPLCSNLLLYEGTKQRKIWILIIGINSLSPLHSSLFLHIFCVICRFSCWIQEMVPIAATQSTSLNRDTFSGILGNS